MMLRGGVCVQPGRAAVPVCTWPPRPDECPVAPNWPVGRDSLTGQDAFEYAGTTRDE